VKLLLDENLSSKLVQVLTVEFPGTTHVEMLGLRGSSDRTVWEIARDLGYTIVSKDNDFRQRSFLYGPPPKVIWLSIGNAGTAEVRVLLGEHRGRIQEFVAQLEEGLLVLRASGS
jgi:predicted nuclease of predicted toxin-antitoxin system